MTFSIIKKLSLLQDDIVVRFEREDNYADVDITGIQFDSRKVTSGNLFSFIRRQRGWA